MKKEYTVKMYRRYKTDWAHTQLVRYETQLIAASLQKRSVACHLRREKDGRRAKEELC